MLSSCSLSLAIQGSTQMRSVTWSCMSARTRRIASDEEYKGQILTYTSRTSTLRMSRNLSRLSNVFCAQAKPSIRKPIGLASSSSPAVVSAY
jgi:hypothetical protein